jgi:hypothetical protein
VPEAEDDMTDDMTTLKDAIENNGPLAVWDLMDEDEKKTAAAALWANGDRDSRMVIEMALAKEMKFRPQSVRKLSVERVAPRLARLAGDMPQDALFQYLFHFHMAEKRELMVEYLDAVGLPHKEGVLDLPEDAEAPTAEAAEGPARDLVAKHGHPALVYLGTLAVADSDFWAGMLGVLEKWDETGEAVSS